MSKIQSKLFDVVNGTNLVANYRYWAPGNDSQGEFTVEFYKLVDGVLTVIPVENNKSVMDPSVNWGIWTTKANLARQELTLAVPADAVYARIIIESTSSYSVAYDNINVTFVPAN